MPKYLRNINISRNEEHPFHLVDKSPWPLFVSLAVFELAILFLGWVGGFNISYFLICPVFYDYAILFLGCVGLWFSNIVIESTYLGNHTRKVRQGLRLGMLLFIISEIMFFFSFFWAWFHVQLVTSSNIMRVDFNIPTYIYTFTIAPTFPSENITVVGAKGLPTLNTLILLASGVTLTCSHEALLFLSYRRGNFTHYFSVFWLSCTIFLGVLFLFLQLEEYNALQLRFNDSIYGSLFYILTGFHGFHVLVGVLFLIVCWFRLRSRHFTRQQHVGFESAIWYWHFVDVVWLIVFVVVYFGGSF